jgi:hypothetical protein
MRDWYGLREGKDDFTIETDADAELFFGRHDLDEQLHAMLRRTFRTGNPPKLVLYGDWGVGKTHTMRHVQHVIEHNPDYAATVVFSELPDITAKSTFQVAHGAFLDTIGFERAKTWIGTYQTKHPNDVRERIHELTGSGDIATAFANLSGFGGTSLIAWEWLRGMSLSAADARSASLPSGLTQSNQLVAVLQMFGRLCKEVDGKVLVFMLDEATKLSWVTNQDAVNHWMNAFKVLADSQTKEIGLIVSASWTDIDDMAAPLEDLQVISRFGEGNYVKLSMLDEDATEDFIRSLLAALIEPDMRANLMAAHEDEADGEVLTAESFPFTEDGLSTMAASVLRIEPTTTPRDIQKALDEFLNRALDDGRHVLSSSYITALVNG